MISFEFDWFAFLAAKCEGTELAGTSAIAKRRQGGVIWRVAPAAMLARRDSVQHLAGRQSEPLGDAIHGSSFRERADFETRYADSSGRDELPDNVSSASNYD